jgi:hypothetical protein
MTLSIFVVEYQPERQESAMIEYQPEMDPDEELFGSAEEARRWRQEREGSWTTEAQWAQIDEAVRAKMERAGKFENLTEQERLDRYTHSLAYIKEYYGDALDKLGRS